MNLHETRRSLHLRVYRSLLRTYPRAFRAEYADQIAQLFNDRLRDASRRGGSKAIAGLWAVSVGDLLTNSIKVRFEQMTNIFAMRSTLFVLAGLAYLSIMFVDGALGLLLLLLLAGLAIYQRKTLFDASKLSFSPWLIVGAGLITMALAFGVTAIPGLSSEVSWSLAPPLGIGGLLTTGFGLGLAVWGYASQRP